MGKLTLGQKADRVLKLLLGVRNPRVLAQLASRGFTEADLEEGWRLLRGLAKVHFDSPVLPEVDAQQLVHLDEWENTWFPLAEATLRRRFSAVHQKVFLNLSQTDGAAVVISVGTFVDRVAALRDGDEQSQQAAKLLHERGLTNAVLDEARALLARLGRPEPGTFPPDLEARRQETLAAEAELWAWYLEWSQIARGVIRDRRLLRELGFLRPVRPGGVEADGGDGEEEELEEEPPISEGRDFGALAPRARNDIPVGMPGSNPFTE